MHVLRQEDTLARLEGAAQEILVELFVSTEHLTAGRSAAWQLFVAIASQEEIVAAFPPQAYHKAQLETNTLRDPGSL